MQFTLIFIKLYRNYSMYNLFIGYSAYKPRVPGLKPGYEFKSNYSTKKSI